MIPSWRDARPRMRRIAEVVGNAVPQIELVADEPSREVY
jgi:hypothetical protein